MALQRGDVANLTALQEGEPLSHVKPAGLTVGETGLSESDKEVGFGEDNPRAVRITEIGRVEGSGMSGWFLRGLFRVAGLLFPGHI